MIMSGVTTQFAIESIVAACTSDDYYLALGSLVVHINGKAFGGRKPTATLLGSGFRSAGRIVESAGMYRVPAFDNATAENIASLVSSIYNWQYPEPAPPSPLSPELLAELRILDLIWEDVDEAFDDGSVIVHLDTAIGVRVIGWRLDRYSGPIDVAEVILPSHVFYHVIDDWRKQLLAYCQKHEVGGEDFIRIVEALTRVAK